jgi:hypothetical protein
VSQTKSDAPDQQKDDAWHRHPALIAAIPAVGAVVGAALTIFLGQAGALPAAIYPAPAPTTVFATQTATSTVIKTARSGSCWDSFHFSTDSLEVRGTYHLTVSVVTEGGAKGSRTADFTVS